MYAHWVPGTNLLLVVIAQSNSASSSSACYDETQCSLSMPPEFKTTYSQVGVFFKIKDQILNIKIES